MLRRQPFSPLNVFDILKAQTFPYIQINVKKKKDFNSMAQNGSHMETTMSIMVNLGHFP